MYFQTRLIFIKKTASGVKKVSILRRSRNRPLIREEFMEEIQRLFIAVELSEEIRRWLEDARTRLVERIPPGAIRWVDPGAIHLTLKFLGDTPSPKLEGIRGVLDALVRSTRPFPLSVEGLGCFPNTARPRVLWAGIRPEPMLSDLQRRLEGELDRAGFPREPRAFSPHLTLGRVREGVPGARLAEIGRAVGAVTLESTVGMDGKDVCLFRSVLRPGGAEYSVLHRSPFSG
jgi:2'-5' RNA ligase